MRKNLDLLVNDSAREGGRGKEICQPIDAIGKVGTTVGTCEY